MKVNDYCRSLFILDLYYIFMDEGRFLFTNFFYESTISFIESFYNDFKELFEKVFGDIEINEDGNLVNYLFYDEEEVDMYLTFFSDSKNVVKVYDVLGYEETQEIGCFALAYKRYIDTLYDMVNPYNRLIKQ